MGVSVPRAAAVAAVRIHEKFGVGFSRRLRSALERLDYLETGEGPGYSLSLTESESDWLDPYEYPLDDVDSWSEPTGYELAGPEASRHVQRQITRGPRKNQTAWYDTQAKKFMPSDWKPKAAKAAKEKPAPKEKAKPAAKAKPSADEVHTAIKAAMETGKPVGKEDVAALGAAILSLKGDEIKALRQRLGQSKGSGTKQKMADELIAKVLGGKSEKPKPPPKPKKEPAPAGGLPADLAGARLVGLKNRNGNVELLQTEIGGKSYVVKPSQMGRAGTEREIKGQELARRAGLNAPRSRQIPRPDVPAGSKMAGMEFDDDAWAVHEKVEGREITPADLEDPAILRHAVKDAVLGWLMGNFDRNDGNVLIDAEGKPHSIDFDSEPADEPLGDVIGGSVLADLPDGASVDPRALAEVAKIGADAIKEADPDAAKRLAELRDLAKKRSLTLGDLRGREPRASETPAPPPPKDTTPALPPGEKKVAEVGNALDAREKKAIKDYTGTHAERMNGELRKGNALSGPHEEIDKGLQSAFAKATPAAKPVKVQRELYLAPVNLPKYVTQMREALSSGVPITIPGYQSTTTKLGAIDDDTNVLVTIDDARGIDANEDSYFPGEGEVLLDRDTPFVVKSLEQKGGVWHVRLSQQTKEPKQQVSPPAETPLKPATQTPVDSAKSRIEELKARANQYDSTREELEADLDAMELEKWSLADLQALGKATKRDLFDLRNKPKAIDTIRRMVLSVKEMLVEGAG